MMGFLLGLLVGAAVTSGGSPQTSLAAIPFRCFAAFEISDAEYTDCRKPSLLNELAGGSAPCTYNATREPKGYCSFDHHIGWEIAALRELKQSLAEQHKQQ